jgi:hypothetical protein
MGLSYIKGYQKTGTVTHNIFVNPSDIHTINIGHGSDGAMTVKQYFVHSSMSGVNKSIYHSSDYAAITNEQYKKLLQEVILVENEQLKELLNSSTDEAMALV